MSSYVLWFLRKPYKLCRGQGSRKPFTNCISLSKEFTFNRASVWEWLKTSDFCICFKYTIAIEYLLWVIQWSLDFHLTLPPQQKNTLFTLTAVLNSFLHYTYRPATWLQRSTKSYGPAMRTIAQLYYQALKIAPIVYCWHQAEINICWTRWTCVFM